MPGIKIYRKNRLNSARQQVLNNPNKTTSDPVTVSNEPVPTPDISNTETSSIDTLVLTPENLNTVFPDADKGNQRIFIQIAGYRDPELVPTIRNILEKADNPENLRFGICWQHHEDDDFDKDLHEFQHDNRFRIIDVPNTISHGTCWARHMIQHLYCEEEFTLAIDSHHRFVEHWDTELKNMYYYMQSKGHQKPLFTGYVTSYKPWLENSDNTNERSLKNGFEEDPWKMIFDRFIPEGAMFFLPTSMTKEEQQEPIPSRFYSAHFCFTTGLMCKEVPHDPNYYFHGEEISIAVRAFTHGYDLFHPHKIICYHEYTRKGRPHHWDDNNRDTGREFDWWEVNEHCHKRNRILFGMDGEDPNQINFGDEYGFGNVRSVEDYENYAGINFKLRAVSENCINHVVPSYETPENPQKWVKNWCVDFFIPWSELPETPDNTQFWYVGVHDGDGNELVREDFEIEKIREIYEERQDPYAARFPLSLNCDNKPASYTVIPYQNDEGWLDKIIKDIDPI